MKNLTKMTDLIQRIDQLKLTAIEEQQTLVKSLNEHIIKSEKIQAALQQSCQQLSAKMEYDTSVLADLKRDLAFDFSQEIAEFEQAYQNENADKQGLAQNLEKFMQEKITFRLNDLKAKTDIASQELEAISRHIQQLFGTEKATKAGLLAKFKRRIYQRFGKQISASKECLAKQLERGAIKLRA
ncbi:hypothetical protein BKG95_10755 [Rodentibacter pneumotropicus]|uniref:Uncharacterized protein n=1 Tax=Rodentibacter pneumotropicus TaxID=758 RepID=A0AAW5LD59_9PAST|nr:hypothetical protein [Rodentibacter pneumotropicus]MCQ9121362.1 hypothetical protein [Rodentibacter pneumotropicus]OOF66401.1 hypothetical protein BKG95_10755 [Rodentibacter pneumotropicus]